MGQRNSSCTGKTTCMDSTREPRSPCHMNCFLPTNFYLLNVAPVGQRKGLCGRDAVVAANAYHKAAVAQQKRVALKAHAAATAAAPRATGPPAPGALREKEKEEEAKKGRKKERKKEGKKEGV